MLDGLCWKAQALALKEAHLRQLLHDLHQRQDDRLRHYYNLIAIGLCGVYDAGLPDN